MGSTNNTNNTSDTATGGGATTSVDDDYNPNLVYTSDNILAMANSGDNTNNSQFFITNAVERPWDFRYTILGVMTKGDAFRQTIANLPTTKNATTGLLQPNDPVVIDSVSLITDTTDGVLELSAPTSSVGSSYTVNILLSDGNSNDNVTVPLTVKVVADPTPPPPYLTLPISDIDLVSGQSTPLNLHAYVPAGATASFTCTASSGLTVSNFSATTGQGTLTAASSFAGQGYLTEEVSWPGSTTNTSSDTQVVPVFVTPATPSIVLNDPLAGTTNTTSFQSGIPFTITGAALGTTVTLYADGNLIASGIAGSTSMPLTTESSVTLTPGTHVFTVKEEIAGTVTGVPNRSDTYDLKAASAPLNVTVSTSGLHLPGFPTSVTVDAGAPLMLALTGTGASSISYSTTGGSSSTVAATVMPSTNRTVQISAHTTTDAAGDAVGTSGVMDFMLMDNDVSSATNYFANLVTSGFYNSAPGDT